MPCEVYQSPIFYSTFYFLLSFDDWPQDSGPFWIFNTKMPKERDLITGHRGARHTGSIIKNKKINHGKIKAIRGKTWLDRVPWLEKKGSYFLIRYKRKTDTEAETEFTSLANLWNVLELTACFGWLSYCCILKGAGVMLCFFWDKL